ncbi:MAG: hypothetical protein AAF901_11530 [Bacteroidota bacterium]
MRTFIPLLSVILLVSCNAVSTHNIKNDYRWRKKKLDQKTLIQLNFDPIIHKNIHENSYFLKPYFTDDYNFDDIKSVFVEKLRKRNIIVANSSNHVINIKMIILKETVTLETVNFLEYDGSGDMESFEKYDVAMTISGDLVYEDQTHQLYHYYDFISEPRESYLFDGLVAHTEPNVNLDRVLNNMVNTLSYDIYLILNNE